MVKRARNILRRITPYCMNNRFARCVSHYGYCKCYEDFMKRPFIRYFIRPRL